jgi:hypothetical protein
MILKNVFLLAFLFVCLPSMGMAEESKPTDSEEPAEVSSLCLRALLQPRQGPRILSYVKELARRPRSPLLVEENRRALEQYGLTSKMSESQLRGALDSLLLELIDIEREGHNRKKLTSPILVSKGGRGPRLPPLHEALEKFSTRRQTGGSSLLEFPVQKALLQRLRESPALSLFEDGEPLKGAPGPSSGQETGTVGENLVPANFVRAILSHYVLVLTKSAPGHPVKSYACEELTPPEEDTVEVRLNLNHSFSMNFRRLADAALASPQALARAMLRYGIDELEGKNAPE